MIVIDESSPRWLRDLARFLPLKNLIFLYGNIYDLLAFPVRKGETNEIVWTESLPQGLLERLFTALNYEVIGYADPAEDLRFSLPAMRQAFEKLQCTADEADSEGKPSATGKVSSPPKDTGSTRTGLDWSRIIEGIARAMKNPQVPCAFVINFASRLVSSPDHLLDSERALFTRMLKASLAGREVIRPDGRRWNNVIVLICDKLNDLPAFLYLNNPRARSIHLELPDREDRRRFIRKHYAGFYDARIDGGVPEQIPAGLTTDFVDLTDGLRHYELASLVSLARREYSIVGDSRPNVRNIIEMYKYGVTINSWDSIDEKLHDAENVIRESIKGQDDAVDRVLEIISRAKFGLAAGDSQKSNRPRGVLFFAGPTGVGKTEMAKSLAFALFGEAERLIRFDMSEYGAEHADQRLLGAPPGYTGYDEGGQLTDAVKKHPFSILLFDEIEKAHPKVLDKFLQILDDGRLTNGKGETVYFSECLIIFTSNLGIAGGEDGEVITAEMPPAKMKDTILTRIRYHFNNTLRRPEILNRFGDNFIVFDFIRPEIAGQIVELLIEKLLKAAQEKKQYRIVVAPDVIEQVVALAKKNLHHGGRGIRNVMDTALINPLSHALFVQRVKAPAQVQINALTDHGVDAGRRFEVTIKCST